VRGIEIFICAMPYIGIKKRAGPFFDRRSIYWAGYHKTPSRLLHRRYTNPQGSGDRLFALTQSEASKICARFKRRTAALEYAAELQHGEAAAPSAYSHPVLHPH